MNHHACMEHPHQRTTKRIGNWLVFGPKHEDGTEWSLCTCTEDGAHLRCVGSFARQADAERIPHLEGAIRAQEAMIRAALEPLGCPDPLYDHHAVEWAAEEIQVLRMERAASQPTAPTASAACHWLDGDTCGDLEAAQVRIATLEKERFDTTHLCDRYNDAGREGNLAAFAAAFERNADELHQARALLRRVAERYPLQIVLDFLEKEGEA